ncbi:MULTISPECIES: hypothetical protein [Burkholderia]|uniref:hypothetical protein n=1 Tax=Burkholderia TaxID=32008 RepID=UPI00158EB233|nr:MULTISPECIES: hypothetical protein [Burkholderia]
MQIDEMRGDDTMARLTRFGNRKALRLERRLASRYNRIIIGPARIEQCRAAQFHRTGDAGICACGRMGRKTVCAS